MEVLRFTLNGRAVEEAGISPTTTLLEYVRQTGLTGTKEGCAEGDCGACTVVVLDPAAPGGAAWKAVNSCLVLLPSLQGRQVYTVEGLQRNGALHPVQQVMVDELGSQCGYCTPGYVMSLFEACYRDDVSANPAEGEGWKLNDQLCGNLCRCTGYRPIRDAARAIAGLRPDDGFSALLREPSQPSTALSYQAQGQYFHQPDRFETLWDLVEAHPDHRFVCGATDLGLDVTKRYTRFPCLVSVEALPGLNRFEATDTGWFIGATVRLSDLERHAVDEIPVLARMLRYFASRQIKNRASVGGNLCNASPIGDLAPVFLALGATAVFRSREGERRVSMDDFFLAYRKIALEPGEILAGVEVPRPGPTTRLAAYKVSKRRELDISAVCAAFAVRVDDAGIVRQARLAYGGMAATTCRATRTEQALEGGAWTEDAIGNASEQLAIDFTPLDDHRGSAWYRNTLARNLLLGFFHETADEPVPRLRDFPSGTVLNKVIP
ncbi:MAG: xanthine dehydrogenase small subunit [Myxococcota bacterium]|jgi:xanthine dehydrogenase small subunit|nr:xanthine dehydrogenase small subunit [Myxococcota bacterium]